MHTSSRQQQQQQRLATRGQVSPAARAAGAPPPRPGATPRGELRRAVPGVPACTPHLSCGGWVVGEHSACTPTSQQHQQQQQQQQRAEWPGQPSGAHLHPPVLWCVIPRMTSMGGWAPAAGSATGSVIGSVLTPQCSVAASLMLPWQRERSRAAKKARGRARRAPQHARHLVLAGWRLRDICNRRFGCGPANLSAACIARGSRARWVGGLANRTSKSTAMRALGPETPSSDCSGAHLSARGGQAGIGALRLPRPSRWGFGHFPHHGSPSPSPNRTASARRFGLPLRIANSAGAPLGAALRSTTRRS